MRAASAAGSSKGARSPSTPDVMISVGPPAAPAITGLPNAIASITTRPSGSRSAKCTTMSIACIQRGRSDWNPANVTADSRPSRATSVRSSGSHCDSGSCAPPTITRCACGWRSRTSGIASIATGIPFWWCSRPTMPMSGPAAGSPNRARSAVGDSLCTASNRSSDAPGKTRRCARRGRTRACAAAICSEGTRTPRAGSSVAIRSSQSGRGSAI